MSIIHLAKESRICETAPSDRRTRLLISAARGFSAHGFKGASLRDIASDAGVSLTLVDHYFGTKEQLLSAVIARHHEACKKRMADLRAALGAQGPPPSLAKVVHAWVRSEFDLYKSEEGADYLLFLIKLMADQHLGMGVQRTLDCSEPIVLHALELARPVATPDMRESAFIIARGALHSAIIDCTVDVESDGSAGFDRAVEFGQSFILGGLTSALH